jgi:hypothetical protein
MKIRLSELKRIIRSEVQRVVTEGVGPAAGAGVGVDAEEAATLGNDWIDGKSAAEKQQLVDFIEDQGYTADELRQMAQQAFQMEESGDALKEDEGSSVAKGFGTAVGAVGLPFLADMFPHEVLVNLSDYVGGTPGMVAVGALSGAILMKLAELVDAK